MRYSHGCKPRNPYNMIIQENHVANRAIFIIANFFHSSRFAFLGLFAYYQIKQI